MKILKQIIIACLSVFCVVFTSCESKYKTNENYEGADYTISTQAEAKAFTVLDGIRTLTISGRDITDVSMLPFKSIKNLVIANTGIEELNMPNLRSVTISVTIDNNPLLRAINGLDNLTFYNGTLTINNNVLLTDISSIKTIKRYKGAIFVTNNPSLGKDVEDPADYTYGLFPILYLAQGGSFDGLITLQNNHPESANEVSEIGQISAGDIRSYTLTSATDVEKFEPKSNIVNNLTVKGIAITLDMMKSIAVKVKEVQGTMTIEGTSVTNTAGFFDVVKCTGSIVLRNNAALSDAIGFKGYTKIGGDFIVDNCPSLAFWGAGHSIAQVKTIEGSVMFKNAYLTDPVFLSLESIGGDLAIISCNANPAGFWNMCSGFPKTIGGDLTISNNGHINTLGGLERLTYLGGNLTITNNGSTDSSIGEIQIPAQAPGVRGWCLVKEYVRDGVIQEGAEIKLTTLSGAPVDVNTLPVCY